jgi:hypothetical protein
MARFVFAHRLNVRAKSVNAAFCEKNRAAAFRNSLPISPQRLDETERARRLACQSEQPEPAPATDRLLFNHGLSAANGGNGSW